MSVADGVSNMSDRSVASWPSLKMLTMIENIMLRSVNLTGLNLDEFLLGGSPLQEIYLSLKYLMYLELRQTSLEMWNASMHNLPFLRSLDLSDSPLKSLDLTEGGSKLEVLKLSNTSLKEFDASTFDLQNLKELHLSDNPIKVLRFEKLKYSIHTLKLDYTQLKIFNTSSYDLNNLDILDIGGSQISVLDMTNGADRLSVLYMQNTKVKYLNGNMLPRQNLHTIDASYSQVAEVDFSGVPRSKIVDLLLVHTNIVSISSKGWNMPFIEILRINQSPFRHLDLSEGMTSLERLELSGTKLNIFNMEMFNIPSLQYLDLSLTNIKYVHIPGSFTHLERLDFYDSNLTCLSSESVPSLRQLYVSGTNIKEIDITSFPNLWDLSLQSNPLLHKIHYNLARPQLALNLRMDQKFSSCDCCWYVLQRTFQLRNRICPDDGNENNCTYPRGYGVCSREQIKCEGR